MKIKLEPIAFIVILFFSLIGMLVTTITIHEYSHWRDMRGLVYEDELCILNVPTNWTGIWSGPAGYYSYYYNRGNMTIRDQVQDVERYTEVKAYSWTFLIIFVFFVLAWKLTMRRAELGWKEEMYENVLNLSLETNDQTTDLPKETPQS